MFLNIEENKSY